MSADSAVTVASSGGLRVRLQVGAAEPGTNVVIIDEVPDLPPGTPARSLVIVTGETP